MRSLKNSDIDRTFARLAAEAPAVKQAEAKLEFSKRELKPVSSDLLIALIEEAEKLCPHNASVTDFTLHQQDFRSHACVGCHARSPAWGLEGQFPVGQAGRRLRGTGRRRSPERARAESGPAL